MIIHSDVWGSSKCTTLGGARWFVTFIDDCTHMTCVCLAKTKGEVYELLCKFHKMAMKQYNAQGKVLQSDNGAKYMGAELKEIFNS